jgi:hypothetical protein
VAELCNYQTCVLHALPQLTSLDTLLLADETKAAAAATLTKKQLYYNMRIRTLRRAAADLATAAKASCQVTARPWSHGAAPKACRPSSDQGGGSSYESSGRSWWLQASANGPEYCDLKCMHVVVEGSVVCLRCTSHLLMLCV